MPHAKRTSAASPQTAKATMIDDTIVADAAFGASQAARVAPANASVRIASKTGFAMRSIRSSGKEGAVDFIERSSPEDNCSSRVERNCVCYHADRQMSLRRAGPPRQK